MTDQNPPPMVPSSQERAKLVCYCETPLTTSLEGAYRDGWNAAQSRISELEAEVARLRSDNGRSYAYLREVLATVASKVSPLRVTDKMRQAAIDWWAAVHPRSGLIPIGDINGIIYAALGAEQHNESGTSAAQPHPTEAEIAEWLAEAKRIYCALVPRASDNERIIAAALALAARRHHRHPDPVLADAMGAACVEVALAGDKP